MLQILQYLRNWLLAHLLARLFLLFVSKKWEKLSATIFQHLLILPIEKLLAKSFRVVASALLLHSWQIVLS